MRTTDERHIERAPRLMLHATCPADALMFAAAAKPEVCFDAAARLLEEVIARRHEFSR